MMVNNENTLLLFVNTTKPVAMNLSQVIVSYCQENALACAIYDASNPAHQLPKFLKQFRAVISLGGDGTALRAGKLLKGLKIPVFAINVGKLGFLANFTLTDWQKNLDLFLKNELTTTKRLTLTVRLKRDNKIIKKKLAINDAVIATNTHQSLVLVELLIDGESLGLIKADGLITSTATGSTAYALSCGGSILPPESDSIMIVPISPFSLSIRPLSLPKKSLITIRICEDQRTKLGLTIDGNTPILLRAHDEVIIKANSIFFYLLQSPDFSFYQVLREKLGWRGLPEGISS